jgi:hypothetical protein
MILDSAPFFPLEEKFMTVVKEPNPFDCKRDFFVCEIFRDSGVLFDTQHTVLIFELEMFCAARAVARSNRRNGLHYFLWEMMVVAVQIIVLWQRFFVGGIN